MNNLYLNESQIAAVKHIKRFLEQKDNKFLLLGPAGSGKTTVITTAFNQLTVDVISQDKFLFNDIDDDVISEEIIDDLIKQKNTNYNVQNHSPDKCIIEEVADDNITDVTDDNTTVIAVQSSNKQTINTQLTLRQSVNLHLIDENIINAEIANIISKEDKKYRVAFCAFTNKATQVLKNTADKFDLQFNAIFSTVHKLLMLEPDNLANENELAFKFDRNKIEHLKDIDVIIIDECSTINKELYQYILDALEIIEFKHSHKIKLIFLGDYWQLPPVGEELSIVFSRAIQEGWLISKLDKVMRSNNNVMYEINQELLSWIDKFKNKKNNTKDINNFIKKYPYNLFGNDRYTGELDKFLDHYLDTWRKQKIDDIVILTYSRKNCEKTNFAIQDQLDYLNDREVPENRKLVKFYPGDRCCLDRTIDVSEIKYNHIGEKIIVSLGQSTGTTIYNGDIFDIILVENVQVYTLLNREKYKNLEYFDGQVLTISNIADKNIYKVIHVCADVIIEAKNNMRRRVSKMFYLQTMNSFNKLYPKLDYGYCITLYKSQGSEWRYVLVNLNSIKWSIVGDDINADFKKKKALLKATYTAITRASSNVLLYWVN